MQKAPTKNAPSRGRPPFQIDGERLRKIRQSQGFTQAQLMRRIKAQVDGKETNSSEETLKNSYRRWEKTGAMDRKHALALAKILGVSIEVLQGQAPKAAPSQLEALEARIRERLTAGDAALQRLLSQETSHRYLSLDDGPNTDLDTHRKEQANLRFVARRLAQQLEYAQLSQDHKELRAIAKLLGYESTDIQTIAETGYWMLLQKGMWGEGTQICEGIHDVFTKIEESIGKRCLHCDADTRVALRKEGAWFRLEVTEPRFRHMPDLQPHFSFVRLQPSESGLQWVQPTWQDEWSIEYFENNLGRSFNYVRRIDRKEKGPRHLANLKLAIYQLPTQAEVKAQGDKASATFVAITGGALNYSKADGYFLEDYKRLLRQKKYGNGHDLFTGNLCVGLMDVLQPLLADGPLQYWKFTTFFDSSHILLKFEPPSWLMHQIRERRGFDYPIFCKYRIELVEELPDGALRNVPWRTASAQRTLQHMQETMKRELDKVSLGPPLPASSYHSFDYI